MKELKHCSMKRKKRYDIIKYYLYKIRLFAVAWEMLEVIVSVSVITSYIKKHPHPAYKRKENSGNQNIKRFQNKRHDTIQCHPSPLEKPPKLFFRLSSASYRKTKYALKFPAPPDLSKAKWGQGIKCLP